MADKKPRLLLVTHFLPLPEGDFLRRKIIGLNDYFDLHLLCWDTQKNKNKFLRLYPDALKKGNLHLYPSHKTPSGVFSLLFQKLFLVLSQPTGSADLIRKIAGNHKKTKKVIHNYLLYAPVIKIKPDIIHFEFGTIAHNFRDIKKYFPYKVSTSFRGYDLNYVGLADPEYYTKVWDTFDGFHFLGNDLRNRAIKRGYKGKGVEGLIPPAIDASFFSPGNVQKNGSPGKLVIISTGRLTWKKGYEYGIRAAYMLKQKNIPFEYRIIGDGNFIQPIQFAISELGLDGHVKMMGSMTAQQIREQLQQADVFLHPAISEGFCNAVLEAQAMGLPVVCTDADGLPENIADNETGFVVPKWDVSAMAEKLEWCYNNPEQAKVMGKKGIERVNKYFRLEDQIKSFVRFYQGLNERK